MRRFVRANSLTLVFLGLFLGALAGQALTGLAEFNAQQRAIGLDAISLGRYLTSADFAVDVAENWQSEYLQFLLFIVLTVWLVQKGSPESKPVDQAGTEPDQEQRVGTHAPPEAPAWARASGWRRALISNSLGLVMGLVFVLSWLAQSVAGWSAYDERQLSQLQAPVSWAGYLIRPEFWNRTFQNWQSEFLAVASMVLWAVFLRQRGSPESKPVGTPHSATGIEG
jgi:hypothetical protein